MFPNAKEIPSPYYAEPVVVDQAQSLALHLYQDLPGRIPRDISKESNELVDAVRTALASSYEAWLQRGGNASREGHENPMPSAGDVHLDGGDNEPLPTKQFHSPLTFMQLMRSAQQVVVDKK